MPRPLDSSQEPPPPQAKGEQVWLRADYTGHVFHYRMPETVATVAVNPVVPSPLTVKMALIAALLRDGRVAEAEALAPLLPGIEVKVRPPGSALVFHALLRYVRPPADRGSQRVDANTGGPYGANPHNREFALWGSAPADEAAGRLQVFLNVPHSLAKTVELALWQVGYLGAKDSLVTCVDVRPEPPPGDCCQPTDDGALTLDFGNFVVRLADFAQTTDPVSLQRLIPSQRDPKHYTNSLFLLPGQMASYGRVKFYLREGGHRA